jgi:cation transport regulator ChaC
MPLEAMWIFGYGSLVFRPSFASLEKRRAYIAGFTRRFWQGSPDHRGVPAAPGLVATLVRAAGAHTGGLAYRIDPAHAEPVLAALDVREQAGFERLTLPLLDAPGGAAFADGLVYLAGPTNPHFRGPLAEPDIAAQVARSHGPSGANRDYVVRLHEALGALGIDDDHLETIVLHLSRRD